MTRLPTNAERAAMVWGDPPPRWVRLLAEACDRSSQRAVGEKIGRTGAWISRVLLRRDGPDFAEAEQLVMARLAEARVDCPVAGDIPLTACVRNRRRRGLPASWLDRRFRHACPDCRRNTDRAEVRATPFQED